MNLKKIYHTLRYQYWFDFCGCMGLGQDKRIVCIKDKYKGRRCFITATGPSLTVKDLELLSNEYTFGVNSIFLMYDKTAWRPDFYVCTDAPYFKKISETYSVNAAELCKNSMFLNRKSKEIQDKINAPANTYYIPFSPWNRIYDFEDYRFQDDLSKGMYAFGTVTNIVIAIAMYMGFTEIYLIGADCSNLNQHFINDVTDKDKDEVYVNRVVEVQIKGYTVMRTETEKRNVKVFNATRGGALEVFPRVKLEEVLKESGGCFASSDV